MSEKKFSFGGHLKEKIGEKIGDRTANVLVDSAYIGNGVYAVAFSFRAAAEAALKGLFENQLPSYVDFSTPAKSALSIVKIGGTVLSLALLTDGIRTLRGRYTEGRQYMPQG